MASARKRFKKDGTRYYEIRTRRKDDGVEFSKYWYPPEEWSDSFIEKKKIGDIIAEFKRQVDEHEIVTKAEQREIEARKAAEAAKIKTVRQYAEEVFIPAKEVTMSVNGISNYKMILDKHILPYIGDLRLEEVTPAILSKRILAFQKDGYAHASQIKLYNVLNGVFDMAFMDDSIAVNPMLKVRRPVQGKKMETVDESVKRLTADEVNTLREYMKGEPLKWRTFIELAQDSWMRRGELCGLRWTDINFDKKILTVRNNLQYDQSKGVYETSPKNGQARKIDLGEDTIELLKQLRKEQSEECISRYVFSQDGSNLPMNPQSPTRYFSKLSAKIGIPGFHPHMLRHTGISIAIANGADVVSVSRRAGHSSTEITMRIYAHAYQEGIEKAGQIYRDAIAAKQG